jgi:hypothetical protein
LTSPSCTINVTAVIFRHIQHRATFRFAAEQPVANEACRFPPRDGFPPAAKALDVFAAAVDVPLDASLVVPAVR